MPRTGFQQRGRGDHHPTTVASSPHLMDMSPLPNPSSSRIDQVLGPSLLPRFTPPLPSSATTKPPPPTAFPFLQNLLARSTSTAPSSTHYSTTELIQRQQQQEAAAEEPRCHSPESFYPPSSKRGGVSDFPVSQRPQIQHFATVPSSHAESLLPPFVQSKKPDSFEEMPLASTRTLGRIVGSESPELLNDDRRREINEEESDQGFMGPPKSGSTSS